MIYSILVSATCASLKSSFFSPLIIDRLEGHLGCLALISHIHANIHQVVLPSLFIEKASITLLSLISSKIVDSDIEASTKIDF
jgi:hypothetical protein